MAVEKKKSKCQECHATRLKLVEVTSVLGNTLAWRCVDKAACQKRRKKREEKFKEVKDLVVKAVRKDRDYLAKDNARYYKENLALKARVAELEAVLSPIVWQANRHAVSMSSGLPEQTVSLTHRVSFLRKARSVLANNPPGRNKKKDWPDFATTARHTIQDLGKELLTIGVLAEEMEIAFEAGYETRRSIELARLNGEKDDFD